MIELQWVMTHNTPQLCQRTREIVVDASGAFCGFTEWSEWTPVPTIWVPKEPQE